MHTDSDQDKESPSTQEKRDGKIGSIRGKYGTYALLVINGDVYYRDSSPRNVATGFHREASGRYTGPDGSSYDQDGAVREIQRRYASGKYD